MSIARDDDVLGGEPHIEGTRVGVRHVVGLLIEGSHDAETVAQRLELSETDVRAALSYYENHWREMRAIEAENAAAYEQLREEALHPRESVR